jgi:hypothetical protein
MAMATSLALVLLLLGAARPRPASAVPCSLYGISSFSSGSLTVEGGGICSNHSEAIKVYCGGATVLIDYAFIDTNDLSGTEDTRVPCGSVVIVDVEGLGGNDRIEMTPLGSTRLENGGAGDDTILIRNGVNDVADCGDGFDSVQADQSKLDAANNCELTDLAPDSPASAAKKKCKKHRKHKCRKHKKH